MGRHVRGDVDGYDVADVRPPRHRHGRGSESYEQRADDVDDFDDVHRLAHSPPSHHHRKPHIRSSEGRTPRHRRTRAASLDDSGPTMLPPVPMLGRSATDQVRRHRDRAPYHDEGYRRSSRRHGGYDTSPVSPSRDRHRRRRNASPEYSAPSGSESSGGSHDSSSTSSTTDSDSEDDGHREDPSEEDDEGPRELRHRLTARGELTESPGRWDSRRAKRRSRLHHSPEPIDESMGEQDSPRHRKRHTASEEPTRAPPRRHQTIDVIDTSRPPVASKSSSRTLAQPGDVVQYNDPRLRRSNTAGSRNSSRSSSRRPSSLWGSLLGGAAAPRRRPSPEKPVKMVECVICMGDIPSKKAPKLKCGHRMCHSCLKRSFRLSITDPQHMPPKCCTTDYIPLEHVERLFDRPFKMKWNRKFAEYSTRNRIYCPGKRCGEWIKPENIRREHGRKVGRCGRCRMKVCGTCNGKWHASAECPKDEETHQFLEQAKEEGWQLCYKCKAVVELKEGCNHMTCRCGAEFCMICGTKWKNCDCPWFNYDNAEPDFLTMDMPMRHNMRGDLNDIFLDGGPPMPQEVRERMAMGGPEPVHRRPHGYADEMHMRQMQEERDRELARRLQLYGGIDDDDDDDDGYGRYDEPRGSGDNLVSVGHAAGHMMNEDYRRSSRYAGHRPSGSGAHDRGPDYVTDVNRARGMRGGSMERRLAERLSENRHAHGSPRMHQMPVALGNPMTPTMTPAMTPGLGLGLGIGMGMGPPMGVPPPVPAPPPPPVPIPPTSARLPEPEEWYHSPVHTPRSERAAGERRSRRYIDDERVYSTRSSRHQRSRTDPDMTGSGPKDSTMAGLNGQGRGMNRVFEWRNFVEPGAPEDDSSSYATSSEGSSRWGTA